MTPELILYKVCMMLRQREKLKIEISAENESLA
jgi:hypothetical protein